ncbi:5-formyltetrahydrofolate cyclo-ligase [bacterium]|nr:5-formyltetrahydrofolate cyclo-ligase [bacterium]
MRRNVLSLRKKLGAAELEISSKKIVNSLISLDVFKRSNVVALYVPIKNEVDLMSLFPEKGKRFVFPRVENGTKKLSFYEASSSDDFEKGSFNIPEPKTTLNKVDVENIDLFLVPGVAFSEKCERIGYGGGFYDATLKYKSKNARTLGVAFDFQIVDSGFSEPFDERLDAVATDERIIINS